MTKNKIGFNAIKLFSLAVFLAAGILTIHVFASGENSVIVKLGFVALLIFLGLQFLIVIRIDKELRLLASHTTKDMDNIKQLLLDLRDGTNVFFEEKRRSDRMENSVLVGTEPSGKERDLNKALSISLTGVSFKTDRMITKDKIIRLTIYLPLFPQPIHVMAKVVRTKNADDNKSPFEIGMEYTELTANDKIKIKETIEIMKQRERKGV